MLVIGQVKIFPLEELPGCQSSLEELSLDAIIGLQSLQT